MSVYKSILSVVFLVFLGTSNMTAQNALATSGGNALGTGGTSSYTVGQIVYNYHSGATGSLTAGVQQSYSTCFGDLNNDGAVDTADLLFLLGEFSCSIACNADLTGDDTVNTLDILAFLIVYGTNCAL
jgi:hypothetical protein